MTIDQEAINIYNIYLQNSFVLSLGLKAITKNGLFWQSETSFAQDVKRTNTTFNNSIKLGWNF
jgi:hypothetical protein